MKKLEEEEELEGEEGEIQNSIVGEQTYYFQPFHGQEHTKIRVVQIRVPHQRYEIFKNPESRKSRFVESGYQAKYTTCGWIALAGASQLIRFFESNSKTEVSEISNSKIIKNDLDLEIRAAGDITFDYFLNTIKMKKEFLFVRFPAPEGDIIEGNICPEVFTIVLDKMFSSDHRILSNIFMSEGNYYHDDNDMGHKNLTEKITYGIFEEDENEEMKYTSKVKNDFWNEEIPELKAMINSVLDGTREYIILIIAAHLPSCDHWMTIAFRKRTRNELDMILLEGFNAGGFCKGEEKEYWNINEFTTVSWLFKKYLDPCFSYRFVPVFQ